MRRALFATLLAAATLAVGLSATPPARADDAADVKAARDRFVRGAELVKEADWAGALVAFEDSARMKPHAVTSFNIGACLRAMGQYTRARGAFARALDENGKAGGGELSPALADETKRYVGELDRLLATLELTIVPEGAAVAVDGRPLEPKGDGFVAGTLPPGPGKPAPRGAFRVVLDPGTHVITIGREGFADAVTKETLAPGASAQKRVELDRLPAQLAISSNLTGAQVLVNDADVGLTPVEISRPAGQYRVVVKKSGFVTFDSNVLKADPGQRVAVTATLREDKPALTQRWWFWTGVGVLVAGAAVTTYALTRPDPVRPGLNGGGLDWSVRSP